MRKKIGHQKKRHVKGYATHRKGYHVVVHPYYRRRKHR